MTKAAKTPRTHLLSTGEAAARARCSTQMLYLLRHLGLGPKAEKQANGRLGFDARVVDAWLASLGGSVYSAYPKEVMMRKWYARRRRLRAEERSRSTSPST